MCEANLKVEVTKARYVFEEHAVEISDVLFSAFPRGSCGNASILLGNWLSHCGFQNIQVILGRDKTGSSHSWLVVDKRIVDITSDQFEEQGYGLYPLDSEYHGTYSEQTEGSLELGFSLDKPYEIFFELMKDA